MPLLSADSPAVHTQQPSLDGRNVMVTGGTTGIGRATAALLAAHGANVFIFGRHEPELRTALDYLSQARGTILGTIADQSRAEDVARVFAAADHELGPLDVLVNNASIGAGEITEGDDAQWRYALQSDLTGYLDCTRHAVDRMKRRGRGHIVNVGSISSVHHTKGLSLYVAAKSAIHGYSRALHRELGPHGIKVSLIEPGLVGTEIFEPGEPERAPEVQHAEQRRGAMLKPEDIAVAVHYCLTQPPRCNIGLVRIEPLKAE
ncbi:MAG TPA: SDR family oxidoreductase [Opitutaceae bacterium]